VAYSQARVCIYRSAIPAGKDPYELIEAVRTAGGHVMAVNPRVTAVDAYEDTGGIVTLMEFRHRDQWWIRRKAPHVAVAILVQAGLDVSSTHLVDVVKPEHVPPRQ
jgi:hypothetical protein